MTRWKALLAFLAVVGCVAGLTSCKDAQKEEQRTAETNRLKAELAKVQGVLEKARGDLGSVTQARDKLEEELKAGKAQVEELLGKVKAAENVATEAAELKTQVGGLTKQLGELTKQRDAALEQAKGATTTIGTLKTQLQEQLKKVGDLEGQVKKLQGTIEELQKKITLPTLP